MRKFRVGVLGATGAVGQRLVQLLEGHPWFSATELVASQRSAGHKYGEVVTWRLSGDIPPGVADTVVKGLADELDCDLVLSALDSAVAGDAETALAAAGFPVISNARNHRMDGDVPLLIPEVNWEHASVVGRQRLNRNYSSGLVATNPNCSAIGLTLALKPLQDAFGVAEVSVVTMQALSGAGINGVAAMTIMDNVIPYVAGEEEKIESETLKILGGLQNDTFLPAEIRVSAQCNRVAVLDGHTEAVSLRLQTPATAEQLRQTLGRFTSEPQRLQLPTAPANPILVVEGSDRPQPQLDRDSARGMAVSVGHIRPCSVLDWKFTLVVHNSIRGAAGAALLNAELLVAQGYIA
jgi:aspartate-semialdehyde dehydrogenase